MEITNSLDWPKVESELWQIANKLQPKFLADYRRMLGNITKMVTELSKKELVARRSHGKSTRHVDEYRAQINEQIKQIEQWATLLMLY